MGVNHHEYPQLLKMRKYRRCEDAIMKKTNIFEWSNISITLWLFNSSPWYRWPIEIDGLPSYKMGGSFQFANCECHNQRVLYQWLDDHKPWKIPWHPPHLLEFWVYDRLDENWDQAGPMDSDGPMDRCILISIRNRIFHNNTYIYNIFLYYK